VNYIENYIGFNYSNGRITDEGKNINVKGIPHLTVTRRPSRLSADNTRIIHLAEGTIDQLEPLLLLHGKTEELARLRSTDLEHVSVVFAGHGGNSLEYEDIEVLQQALQALRNTEGSLSEYLEIAEQTDLNVTDLDEGRFRVDLGRLEEFHSWASTDPTNPERWQLLLADMLLDGKSPEGQMARIAGESLYYAPSQVNLLDRGVERQ